MGVRVDQAGSLLVDYHTAQQVAKTNGSIKPAVLSWRHYLVDACFLAGLEGPRDILLQLDAALHRPAWQFALGRKSCVPSLPVRLPDAAPEGPGLIEAPLEQALRSVSLVRRSSVQGAVPLVRETVGLRGDARQDVPLCFASRRFGSRLVIVEHTRPEEYPACISPDCF